MTNDEAIKRKQVAERLLKHELMVEARQHMHDALTRALWRRHTMSAADQARLDAMVAHSETFWSFFDSIIKGGQLIEFEVEQKRKAQQILDGIKQSFRI